VAIGARAPAAFERVITFRASRTPRRCTAWIQDVEGGYAKSIAFVVAVRRDLAAAAVRAGASWPPSAAYGVNMELELTLITPEDEPLGLFGREAADSVAGSLADARITVVARRQCPRGRQRRGGGGLGRGPSRARQRIVALACALEGPASRG
jgi:hypothetical protein